MIFRGGGSDSDGAPDASQMEARALCEELPGRAGMKWSGGMSRHYHINGSRRYLTCLQ